jgi:hypothetical protein
VLTEGMISRLLHISNATVPRGIMHSFRVVLDVIALEPGELIKAEL